ncbi:hypothetical protein AWA2013_32500 (plasmid) [Lactiplantibacillus plantarum]|nr:acyltransferase [Lactiplantibacillus plantarum]BEI51843.1 hypothetical protein AWA2013_32500 [Lactiplantibacillus plantarum]
MKSNKFLWNLVANELLSSHLIPSKIRCSLLKKMGMDIAKGSIRSGCYFRSSNVKIGLNTWINNNCFFDNDNENRVEIGKNCGIGMDVLFCVSSHEIGTSEGRAGKDIKKGIKIGNGCWLGARVTILPGVEVKEGCIIAAGAVVINDCEPNGLYAGVPAKRIKDLN